MATGKPPEKFGLAPETQRAKQIFSAPRHSAQDKTTTATGKPPEKFGLAPETQRAKQIFSAPRHSAQDKTTMATGKPPEKFGLAPETQRAKRLLPRDTLRDPTPSKVILGRQNPNQSSSSCCEASKRVMVFGCIPNRLAARPLWPPVARSACSTAALRSRDRSVKGRSTGAEQACGC